MFSHLRGFVLGVEDGQLCEDAHVGPFQSCRKRRKKGRGEEGEEGDEEREKIVERSKKLGGVKRIRS